MVSKKLFKYICFGLQSFREEDDIPGSPQGSPPASRWWRWWSTRWLSRTSLRGFLRTGRGESCWGENRTFFFIPRALWRGAGEAGANGGGADGAGANGAGDDGGLQRRGDCWGVTGWSESTGLSRSTKNNKK